MYPKLTVRLVTILALLFLTVTVTATPTIEFVGSYDTGPDSAYGVHVSGNFAYLGLGDGGLKIINISNPADPTLASSYATPSYVRDLYVSGQFAYVTDRYTGVLVLDISDPTTPDSVSTLVTGAPPGDVQIEGNFAYVASSQADLEIFDVSDPHNPAFADDLPASGFADGVFVTGGYTYVAKYNGGLQIVDVSDPYAPTLAGWYYSLSGHDVHVAGNYACVGARGGGLQIIDVSDASNPIWVSSYPTPGIARGVFVSGDHAFVTDRSVGLHVVNVSDPANPILAGLYETPGQAFDVHVSGAYVFVADRAGGLQILRFAIPVAFDIKPGSCPNPLNVKGGRMDEVGSRQGSNMAAGGGSDPAISVGERGKKGKKGKKAVLPVAILGTAEFDAAQIDATTVVLAGVSPVRWNYEDVATPVAEDANDCECNDYGPDGLTDMTLKFDKAAVIAALGEVYDGDIIPLTISGQLLDGTSFEGVDCVIIRARRNSAPTNGEHSPDHDPAIAGMYNFPNPFNPTTEISFSLPEAADVRLEVFNIMGQRVTTVVDRRLDAGMHSFEWDGSQVASGVYFYRLTAGDITETRKMMLLK